MRMLLILPLLAGCPASADSPPDAAGPSCTNLTAPPVTLAGLRVEPCELDGITGPPREIAVANDGTLYVVTPTGGVERWTPRTDRCAFTRDASFTAPPGDWRSIEATADGRIYLAKAEGTSFVLAWLGSSSGMCSDARPYRPVIAAAGDGVVVMAPATGNGLRRIDTATCTVTDLAFAAADPARVLGRVDADVVYGCSSGPAGRARHALDGTVRFREASPGFAGTESHSLEYLGGAVASWAVGFLHQVDATTGAPRPALKYDTFFATTTPRASAEAGVFAAAPDGSVGYVLATEPEGACPVLTSLYRLTPI